MNSAEKKPKPENIDIYTLKITSDRRCKVVKMTLADVWKQGCIIRINNFGDKDKAPHSEKDIKNQVSNWFNQQVAHFIIIIIANKNHLRSDFVFIQLKLFRISFRKRKSCSNCCGWSIYLHFLCFSVIFFASLVLDFIWNESKTNAVAWFATFRNVVSLWWSTTGYSTTAGSWNTELFL